MVLPLMISRKDDDLVGVANRSDPMGVLAVWQARARDMVPHLTEQTRDVRAFQILVEAFNLWDIYSAQESVPANRLGEFFMLIEQAFARTIGRSGCGWPLPGARRVGARSQQDPCISIVDKGWHLLDGQLASGIWGLYRGASARAGLLGKGMAYLSEETAHAARCNTCLKSNDRERLFGLVRNAMEGKTVSLPTHGNDSLVLALRDTFTEVPLKHHLRAKLIDGHDLNREIAERLASSGSLDRREFIQKAAIDLEKHRSVLEAVIDCENLLAVIENIFDWLCCWKGEALKDAAASLPVDLARVEVARKRFADTGTYAGQTATSRQTRMHQNLKTSDVVELARSVIGLHKLVSDERDRTPWVWLEDGGQLQSDADTAKPTKRDLTVDLAWRNDYYLHPLRSIVRQLNELGP